MSREKQRGKITVKVHLSTGFLTVNVLLSQIFIQQSIKLNEKESGREREVGKLVYDCIVCLLFIWRLA